MEGWEIRIPKSEMKVKKNGDFTLAIPLELAEWLQKIAQSQPDEKYLFPNPEHGIYCEATFRKALRSYKADNPGNERNFTPHSFRRTMTTILTIYRGFWRTKKRKKTAKTTICRTI